MIHELKILPEYFNAVVNGSKTFEIRKNDRNFQVGDTLLLQEYDSLFEGGEYTGKSVQKEIIYILDDDSGYVLEGYVVMGIR